jgi:hypothetical protein
VERYISIFGLETFKLLTLLDEPAVAPVNLAVTKHLIGAAEILRFAQDDGALDSNQDTIRPNGRRSYGVRQPVSR